jgi:hypothetical protein
MKKKNLPHFPHHGMLHQIQRKDSIKMRNLRSLILKSLMLSVISGFALTAALPAPAQAFPGMAQESAKEAPQAADAAQMPSGKVVETINSGGYTYVCLENSAKKKIWGAVPQTTVKVGQQVILHGAFEMKNFTSSSLNRTFESIYFAKNLSAAQ